MSSSSHPVMATPPMVKSHANHEASELQRIEPKLLRKLTARRVLDVLRDGPTTRAEIVRRSGISAPTISRAVASLVQAGLLEETETPAPTGLGRPGLLFQMARRKVRVVGINWDVDKIEIVTAGLDGGFATVVKSLDTPSDYASSLTLLEQHIKPLTQGASVLGIGISAPGLMDREHQRILLSPNMPMMNGRAPAPDLAKRLGVPCSMFQESHALCLAASSFGGARATNNFAVVEASVGLGLGVMQNGELVFGHRGLVGEIGHMTVDPDGLACGCGNRGCLETRATDVALARLISEKLGEPVSIEQMIEHITSDPDRFAAEIDATSTWFAISLAAVINIFNPAKLFIHSRWLRECPWLFDTIAHRTRRRALDPSAEQCLISQAEVTKLQGAVAGALYGVFNDTTIKASYGN